MYATILVTLEGTEADDTIIRHILPLAKLLGSQVMLLHVADGWAARTFGSDAVSPEVDEDTAYIKKVCTRFEAEGVRATAHLAFGDPAPEIVKWVHAHPCDLIAMSTHGHRLVGDILHGATAHHVQHRVDVPVLLLKMKK